MLCDDLFHLFLHRKIQLMSTIFNFFIYRYTFLGFLEICFKNIYIEKIKEIKIKNWNKFFLIFIYSFYIFNTNKLLHYLIMKILFFLYF